ncbi:MAG: sigma-70 family RNA polymerase sigma factor [Planctomycetota bacterium]
MIPSPIMHEIPETRESLLLQVQDPSDRLAWEEFVEMYRPVIYRIAVARGLQHADALDLVQTVFIAIARSIGHWKKRDPSTRFRHWLRRVAKNATINAVTRRPPDQPLAASAVEELLSQIPESEHELESLVDLEYRRELFARAAEQVRVNVHPDTWAAFELTAVNGMSKEAAAAELGKSIGTIYAARSRVMKRLSAMVAELEGTDE